MALLTNKNSELAELTTDMEIKDSNGELFIASNGKTAVLTIKSAASKEFKKAIFDNEKARAEAGKSDNHIKSENRTRVLAKSVIIGWKNVEFEDGVFAEFTPENLDLLLRESTDSIAGQVFEYVMEKNNFLKKTSLAA